MLDKEQLLIKTKSDDDKLAELTETPIDKTHGLIKTSTK